MYEKGNLIVTIYASQPILVNIGNFTQKLQHLGLFDAQETLNHNF